MLSYQKLDVYQCAIEFLAVAAEIIKQMPRKYSFLADHLKEAAVSSPLNIAEGTGKPTEADSSRFFSIARGSSMECGAILDACKALKLADPELLQKGGQLIERVVSMLTKMIKF
ncbi:MAG TPA: four helix bundle protein [Acidobacteriota bacterium]|jgi:four helix bundle protein|nr:four helix bundle protein [Acidobacteriota bacterium]